MEELLLKLERLMHQVSSEAWTTMKHATIGAGRVDFEAFTATGFDGQGLKAVKKRPCYSNC